MAIDISGLGQNGLDFLQTGDEQSNHVYDVINLEVDKINPDLDQPRKDFSQEELDKLAYDIQQNGLLQPIIVRRGTDHNYIIVAGERRFKAVKQIGLEKIACIIREDLDSNLEVRKIQMSENLKRDNLKFWEIAEYIVSRLNDQEYPITQAALAKELGISKQNVGKYAKWEKASDFLKDLARENKIPTLRLFYELVISNLSDDEILERVTQDSFNASNLFNELNSRKSKETQEQSNNFEAAQEQSNDFEETQEQSNNFEAAQEQSNNFEAAQEQSNSFEAAQEQSNDFEETQEQSNSFEAAQEQSNDFEETQEQSNSFGAAQEQSSNFIIFGSYAGMPARIEFKKAQEGCIWISLGASDSFRDFKEIKASDFIIDGIKEK